MRKLIATALLLFFSLIVGGGGIWGVLHAADVSGALYTMIARWSNTGATDQDDIPAAFAVSGAAFIDQNLIAADALNAALQKGNVDQPGMPPTTRIAIEGLVLKQGESFTDYTAAAQEDTTNDVPLLPIGPGVNDAVLWGCDNPCRIVTFDLDTAGVNDLTLAWEYWDGDSFETLSGVTDDTNDFTTVGRETVSWDMPADWATTTVTGSAVNSFWGRARVSAVTSATTQPLAGRVFYENGQWWTWIEDIDTATQEQYTLYLGGDDMLIHHQIFPGTTGIVTADAATIEPGGAFSLGYQGRLDFGATGTSVCYACKTSALTLHATGSAAVPGIFATLTGSGTTNLELSGISLPNIGSQTITMGVSGSTVALFADAGGGAAFGTAQTITDNGNSWNWGSQGSTDYIDYIRLYTSSPTTFDITDTSAQWAAGTLTNTAAYTGALGLANE
jgi:hypothetical protein